MKQFTDAAGRTAWVDANGMVFTEGGSNPTYYNVNDWNERQLGRWGAPSSSSSGGYSKSAWAKQLGISKEELERRAREAGYSTTEAFYNATNGTGSIPKSPEEYAQAIIDAQQEQINRETSFIKDYLAKNPFAFDELLAKQSASAEYEPYYTELLNDYIQDIDVKRATVEDDKRLSEYLSERSAEKTSREYEQAIASAEEGFAGSGMFFSGIKDRTGGLLGIEKTGELADIATKQDYAQRGYDRQLGSLQTSEERQRRDIAREQDTAIAGGIETRRGEAMKQYYTPLTQSYYRQFPTSSGGTMKGYMPESYLMY